MTARELFEAMTPLIGPAIEREFCGYRSACILATRVAIETAAHFGIEAAPLPVKVIVYNAAFARHVACDFADVEDRSTPASWGDGSWSVGIGCGAPYRPNSWDGHVIVVSDGCFADFSIQQAERPQYGIVTGPALVGPWSGADTWRAVNDAGTVVEYRRTDDEVWRTSPDWRDGKRRRAIAGKVIRALG